LRGGISETAPFHWNGDIPDMGHLASEVFTARMSGPKLTRDQTTALGRWVDTIAALPSAEPGSPSVERGRALFTDPHLLCVSCHSGPRLTSNTSVDVGTGGKFQVPSLLGVRWRAPYLHSGCAPTLRARFSDPCAGGDQHGNTSHLTDGESDDLIAFLASL
jgi:hypothetical protein